MNICVVILILEMEEYATFLAYSLYYFKKCTNSTESQKTKTNKICAVCGEGTMTDPTCQKWFVKFCAGDLLVE